jgi:transcriptional regulator with XRE-family HTH domain
LSDVTDIGDLLRYAAKAQLAHLKKTRNVQQKSVAEAIGMTQPQLTGLLNNQNSAIEARLHDLDGAVFAFDPAFATKSGGLVALAARLRGYKAEATTVGKMPSIWVSELLKKNFDKPIGFLIQASALLSAFMGAKSQHAASAVCAHHQDDLEKVVYPLLMVGTGAPATHSIDALILLGALARHRPAFEGQGGHGIRDTLREALTGSPLGFRAWRVITSIVHAAANTRDTHTQEADSYLRGWVQGRLEQDSPRLRDTSLYPARSLDLELAIAIPAEWTKDRDWATDILVTRAVDPKATLRERGTAAMGIWERALSYPDVEPRAGGNDSVRVARAKKTIQRIIRELAQEGEAQEALAAQKLPRPYDSAPPGGRQWLIATLQHMIEQKQKVASTWPSDGHPCLTIVADGAARLIEGRTVPDLVRDATVFLFQQALLQNAGVYRRKAIDTLRGAGMGTPTARALTAILDHHDAEPWLRCRALFAIGFLQDRDDTVESALKDAFDRALEEVERHHQDHDLTRDVVSELHAAIFAIGDCYGALGQEKQAQHLRQHLERTLWPLVERCRERELFPISRAAAYLLTVAPQKEDRERLEKLRRDHPDSATQNACDWALQMRFDREGNVRPLHLAPPPT